MNNEQCCSDTLANFGNIIVTLVIMTMLSVNLFCNFELPV